MDNNLPLARSFIREHRTASLWLLGASAVMVVAVFVARHYAHPDLSHVPVPFINQGQQARGSSLGASVTFVKTLANGIQFFQMDFQNSTTQQAPADKVYLISVPSAVSPIAFEQAIINANPTKRGYYGYIYTSTDAAQEIQHQNDILFKDRFPGVFFASAKALADHGADLHGFEQTGNVLFKLAGSGHVNNNGILLAPSLIAFVPVDQDVTINVAPLCGDDWKGTGEACDDGNLMNDDGCSSTCNVEAGFICSGDPNTCTDSPACGDGIRDSGEACDDGNTDAADGCSATCTVESGSVCNTNTPNVCTSICGDGTRNSGEACDDGNADSGDGCSQTCTVESAFSCDTASPNVCSPDPVCGDSVIDEPETCDDGNADSGDGCSATCTTEAGFSCNNTDPPSVCLEDPACGDGNPDQGEACDDGNTDAADGCSATCTIESGYMCNAHTPSVCTLLCGDGIRDSGEACDDGNGDSGDGCSATCTIESAFTCDASTPNVCTPDAACGDGSVDSGEACDDGNVADADGCSATCTIEANFICDNSDPPSLCTPTGP